MHFDVNNYLFTWSSVLHAARGRGEDFTYSHARSLPSLTRNSVHTDRDSADDRVLPFFIKKKRKKLVNYKRFFFRYEEGEFFQQWRVSIRDSRYWLLLTIILSSLSGSIFLLSNNAFDEEVFYLIKGELICPMWNEKFALKIRATFTKNLRHKRFFHDILFFKEE